MSFIKFLKKVFSPYHRYCVTFETPDTTVGAMVVLIVCASSPEHAQSKATEFLDLNCINLVGLTYIHVEQI